MRLDIKDVAKILDVSDKTIYRWINQGQIPFYRINDQYRFSRAEILEWATAGKMRVSPDILNEPESAADYMPTLSDAIRAGGIVYRVSGSSKKEVLRNVVDLMKLPEEVDQEFLFQALLAREDLGSTAIGNGIAIPHVRNPLVLHIPKPSITICFLEKPLEFEALDGQPVHTLFTLVSPTVRAHLHMLCRLSFILRNETLIKTLRNQQSREEILEKISRLEADFKQPTGDSQS